MAVTLVTGVAGQDGSYLAEQLLRDGWTVHGLVRPGGGGTPVPGVVLHEGDLLDPALFPRLLDEVRPDVVHHLAGLSSVARSWQEPVLTAEVNGSAVARLLAACSAGGAGPRVVLASSAEVFAGSSASPQDERTTVLPTSPYGAAKAWVLHLARVHRAAGHHVSAAILYNHESPRRPQTFVTMKIAAGAARIARGEQELLELGNLDAVRDWGWAPEYVDALVRVAAADTPDDYVLATGRGRTVEQFVEAALTAAGLDDWRRYVRRRSELVRPTDAAALVGDASKAGRVLGWFPQVGFEELVRRLVAAS